MSNQLPIIQEIDGFLEDKKLKEVYEKVISIPLSSGNDTTEISLRIFFTQLKRGILYTHEIYGIVADHFDICDDVPIHDIEEYNNGTISYIAEYDYITIKHKNIAILCTSMIRNHYITLISLKYQNKKYWIKVKDNMFLTGVEESHHAFYIKSGQGKYSTDNNTLKEYKNNPIEIAAFPVVRQAIEDQSIQLYTCSEPSGYGKYSPCPYPKWIKR
jgi:hypothetical protein